MTPYQQREVFRQANALMGEGEFAAAARRYDALVEAGIVDPALHYNAGNAHAELGQPGLAVWNYEKARWLAPRDPDIEANLRLVAPPENHPPVFVLWRPFVYVAGLFSLGEVVGVAVAAWWIGTLALAGAVLARGGWARRGLRLTVGLSAVALVAFGTLAAAKASYWHGTDWMIVTADPAIGRNAPTEDARTEFELPGGLRIRRVARLPGGWIEARLPSGERTFLRGEAAREL